ncbi:MAG TPA: peptidyl-prolyl cis-trans isomerase [Deltaproteobacteria bacterium]|nr:peptidyl-prolyl cis-trans isomerase [Deltaproteobacteria bacterium]
MPIPRSPLLHFLLIGGLLFLVVRSFPTSDGTTTGARSGTPGGLIVIDGERVDALRERFANQMGRPPDPEELERLIADEVDEEILYREAIARGLLETDAGVKTRLVQKMLFLEDDAENRDPRVLLERARALGLDRGDLVVRRILIQKMKRLGSALRVGQEPSEEAIAEVHALERETFREPDRRTFLHVFFPSKTPDEAGLEVARRVLQRIVSQDLPPEDAIRLGAPFPLGSRFEHQSLRDLDRRFGMDLGKRVFAAPLREWSGPIASAYGWHLVRVEAVEPGRIRPFESVRDEIRYRLEERIRTRNLERLLEELRTRYEFVVAGDEGATAS